MTFIPVLGANIVWYSTLFLGLLSLSNLVTTCWGIAKKVIKGMNKKKDESIAKTDVMADKGLTQIPKPLIRERPLPAAFMGSPRATNRDFSPRRSTPSVLAPSVPVTVKAYSSPLRLSASKLDVKEDLMTFTPRSPQFTDIYGITPVKEHIFPDARVSKTPFSTAKKNPEYFSKALPDTGSPMANKIAHECLPAWTEELKQVRTTRLHCIFINL